MSLPSGSRNHFILDDFCSKVLTILLLFFFFSNHLFHRIKSPNSQHMSFFLSHPPFCFSYDLNFFLDAQNFVLFAPVAMLSLCQSPVNCWNEKVEGKFRHKVNLYSYLKGRDRRLFQIACFFDDYVGTDEWQWERRYVRVR